VFTLTNGGLFSGAGTSGPKCETANLEVLRELVTAIGRAYGRDMVNGRFALNQSRQVIRKLPPPPKVAKHSVYVVGVKAPEIVRYTEQIIVDGKPLQGVGPEIMLSAAYADLPLVSTHLFEKFESALAELIKNAASEYSSAA
jgi:hypothetical protein